MRILTEEEFYSLYKPGPQTLSRQEQLENRRKIESMHDDFNLREEFDYRDIENETA
jgi:hypothetical protein